MPLLFLHPSKPPTLYSKSTQTLVQSPKHPSFRQTHISFSSNNESFYSLSTTHLPIQGIQKLGLLVNSSHLPFSRKAHVSFCSKNGSFQGLATTHLSNQLEHGKIQVIRKLGLLVNSSKTPCSREAHVSFCSKNESFEGLVTTQLPIQQEDGPIGDIEELGLLGKPTPKPIATGDIEVEVKPPKPDEEEALKPFLKFFTPRDSLGELSDVGESSSSENEKGEGKKVIIEYYDPKPGDFVIGVVVSGNENRLDVNVGADYLGTMLTKEVLPLYGREMDYLLCDTEKDADEFLVYGKMGIVKDEVAVSADLVAGRPVVEVGTVLFAEVLGRTLSGRPLLSTRRFFRRIAWHRVRQIKQLNEPIEVTITEWNTGGLLTRIEGLRAFLPKNELMGKVNSFTDLKDNVGRKINVKITRIDEANNDLILSEKSAWEMLNLREGALLEGTVRKIYPFGAQIRIGETNRSGLLHISNLSKGKLESVSDVLAVDEKVKVLVIKSLFPGKISLSTADLESEPGLFVSNKEKVFSEAEAMARKYRQKLPTVSAKQKLEPLGTDGSSFCNEPSLYSNWKWFQFEEASE